MQEAAASNGAIYRIILPAVTLGLTLGVADFPGESNSQNITPLHMSLNHQLIAMQKNTHHSQD
jgi:hypothetical protein